MIAVSGWMAKMSLGYVDFLPGDEAQPPLAAAGQKLAATICYEDAYAVERIGHTLTVRVRAR